MTKTSETLNEFAISVDTHADTFARVLDEHRNFFSEDSGLAVTLPGMVQGELDAQIFALYVAPGLPEGQSAKRALAMAGCFFQAVASSGGRLVLVGTARELVDARRAGKKCGLLSVEGGHIFGGDLNVLRSLRSMGVISLTLTHTNTNDFADSSQGERRWGGLNDLGREVVKEMNQLRMLVDVSHASDETVEATLEVSTFPVIASHSCCRAICDYPRNLPDHLIKEIAQRGGVVHIAYYPPYLSAEAAVVFANNWERLGGPTAVAADTPGGMEAFYARCMEGVPDVRLSKLCDHIDHAVSLVGPGHVGLGSDWDGANIVVQGLESCAKLPLLRELLAKRGYRPDEINLIMGGSFIRLLEEVAGV